MNVKRFIIASVVVLIIFSGLEFLFHTKCLADLYAATSYLWRPTPEMVKLMPYGHLITLIVSFLFTYIYVRGYQAKSSALAEGFRFGLIVGLFVSIPMAGWSYITTPMPLVLATNWFVMGMAKFLIAGTAVGLIYKGKQ